MATPIRSTIMATVKWRLRRESAFQVADEAKIAAPAPDQAGAIVPYAYAAELTPLNGWSPGNGKLTFRAGSDD